MTTTQSYDSLHRLQSISSLPSGDSPLSFAYNYNDANQRTRVAQADGSYWVYEYDSLGQVTSGKRYWSDGTPVRSFMRGTDLSGSSQGAGGVGGLLAFTSHEAPASTYFAAYDDNGNVAALVDGKTGTASARYEQGPFAEAIRESGAAAGVNPVKFSSKYQDRETDQFYYGYRFYNPSQGRWLSRDPIAEAGGENLYGLVRNSTAGSFDKDGRLTVVRESNRSAECGKVQIRFWFNLDQAASCAAGYGLIVQENRVYLDSEPCSKAPFVPPPDTLVNHMWEAFKVMNGQITHDAGGFTDSVDYAKVNDSSGALVAHGTLKFFCADRTGNLDEKADDPNDSEWGRFEASGGLPSTKKEPSWWNDTPLEGPTYRIVEADWDCCPCRRTWNVSSTP